MPSVGDPKICDECGYVWEGQTIEDDCDSFVCNVCADADTAFCNSCEQQCSRSILIERGEDPDHYTCGECLDSQLQEQRRIEKEEQKAWAEERRRKSIEEPYRKFGHYDWNNKEA
ncbi:MAG: hypothetical protein ACJZ2K_02385 [Candidatus Poseidoniaceae archaeon]